MNEMLARILLIAAVSGSLVGIAADAPSDSALYISNAQLQAIMGKIAPSKETGKPGSFSSRQFTASTYSMSFIRIGEPDLPHVHGAWSEVYVIRGGSGILETGGKVTGITANDSATHKSLFVDEQGNSRPSESTVPRKADPGDLAGGAIEGGKQQSVAVGDVILIPAGVAHRWLEVEKPVVYLDIKFPKAR